MNKILRSLSVSAVAVLALTFHTMAQTVQDGLRNLDAERYNAAGTIFNQLATSAPTEENYFYQGVKQKIWVHLPTLPGAMYRFSMK